MNFFKSPFEKFAKESLDEIIESIKINTSIFLNIQEILQQINEQNDEIISILDTTESKIKKTSKIDKTSDIKQNVKDVSLLGKGLKNIIEAVKAFDNVNPKSVDRLNIFLGKLFKVFKDNEKVITSLTSLIKSFLFFGAGLILFAVGIFALQFLITPKTLLAVILLGAVIFGLVKIASYFSKDMKNIKQFSESLLILPTALIMFAVTMLLVSSIYAILPMKIIPLLVFFGMFFMFLYFVSSVKFNKTIKDVGVNLLLIPAAFLLFAITMLLVSSIYTILPMKIIPILLFLGMFFLFLYVIASTQFNRTIKNVGINLLLITGALFLFAINLLFLSYVFSMLMQQENGLLSIILAFGLIFGIFYLLGKMSGDIIKGTIGLLLISTSFIILGYGLKMIVESGILQNLEPFGLFLLILSGFILVITAVSKNLLVASIGVLLLGAGLLIVGIALEKIKWLNNEFVTSFGLFLLEVTGFLTLLVATFPFSLIAIGLLVTLGAGLLVFGNAMERIKKINLVPADGENLKSVIKSLIDVFTTDMNFSNIFKVTMGLKALSGIGNSLSGIATGIQAMANLKFFEYELVDDGQGGKKLQLKNVVPLSSADIQNAAKNIAFILDTLVGPIQKFGEGGFSMFGFSIVNSAIEKGLQRISTLSNSIGNIVNGIIQMASMSFIKYKVENGKIVPDTVVYLKDADIVNAASNLGKILSTLSTALVDAASEFTAFDEDSPFIDVLSKFSTIINGLVDGIIKLAEGKIVIYEIDKKKKALVPSKIISLNEILQKSASIEQNMKDMLSIYTNVLTSANLNIADIDDESLDKLNKFGGIINTLLQPVLNIQEKNIDANKFNTVANNIIGFIKNLSTAKDINTFIFGKLSAQFSVLFNSVDNIERIANAFERMSKSIKIFKDEFNKLDIKIVKEATALFEAMNYLGSNQSDKFIEKYSKSLTKTFEELKRILNDIKNNTTPTGISASGNYLSAGSGITKPNNITVDNSNIISKLDNLIDEIKLLQASLVNQGIKISNISDIHM